MFRSTPVYDVDGTVVFGLMRPVIAPGPGDTIFTVTQPWENRLDKISAQFYSTTRFWWAIAQINNLVDPLTEIPVGTQLRIPNRARLPA